MGHRADMDDGRTAWLGSIRRIDTCISDADAATWHSSHNREAGGNTCVRFRIPCSGAEKTAQIRNVR